MNKTIYLIIGLVVIVGVVFGLWAIYKQPAATSQGVLDRIEAAIRAKLER